MNENKKRTVTNSGLSLQKLPAFFNPLENEEPFLAGSAPVAPASVDPKSGVTLGAKSGVELGAELGVTLGEAKSEDEGVLLAGCAADGARLANGAVPDLKICNVEISIIQTNI